MKMESASYRGAGGTRVGGGSLILGGCGSVGASGRVDELPIQVFHRHGLLTSVAHAAHRVHARAGQACMAQPDLPQARGIDAPAFLIRRDGAAGDPHHVFEQVYQPLEERSKQP